MAFTRDNFLSFRTLEGIADLRAQFAQLLHEAGFLGTDGKSKNRGGRGARGVKTIPAPRGAAGVDAPALPASSRGRLRVGSESVFQPEALGSARGSSAG